MTLTAILPGLRRSIPDPLNVNVWPEITRAGTTDVVVSGVSLLRLVDVCGTPCVHVAAGVVPGTGGRPAADRQATAIVVAVTEVRTDAAGRLEVLIDACLDSIPAVWTEMRLIGRASCAHAHPVIVLPDESRGAVPRRESPAPAVLPDDIRAGDLLAVPCPDAVVLRDLRPVAQASIAPAASCGTDAHPSRSHGHE